MKVELDSGMQHSLAAGARVSAGLWYRAVVSSSYMPFICRVKTDNSKIPLKSTHFKANGVG